MNNTKKMYLVPYQSGGEGTPSDPFTEPETVQKESIPRKGNSIRKYAAERQMKLLQIVLKLAASGCYDTDGRIKTSSGEEADIVPLLLLASSPGRSVRGLPDFVDLLYRSGVTPDMIINSSVREELSNRMKSGTDRKSVV